MKKHKKTMKFLTTIFLAIFFLAEVNSLSAQDRIPREHTNPEEIISLDRNTPFPEAVELLNGYAQKHQNRFILDKTRYTGTIGISLPPMHWRDALEHILHVHDFTIVESPSYYELLTREQASSYRLPERTTTATTPVPDDILSKINMGTREVRINATFFEGSKRALREIGVDWSTLTRNTPTDIGQFVGENSGGGSGQGQLPTTEFDNTFVNVNAKGAQNVSQNVFNALVNFGEVGGVEVQALFSAFEADNLGKILATPSIKVMNGEEGRIQVGQDFSIKQRDFAGNVTDQFFSTGTILTVIPQIVEIGDTILVYLDLQAERSSAQPDPVSTIVNRQQANTHALLLDGESTVIAGLFRTEESVVTRGIPILKDLPGWFFGLKYLFGYNSKDVQENELIILLQAELEEPIHVRATRAFESQRQLLENRQELHRARMDTLRPNPVMQQLEP